MKLTATQQRLLLAIAGGQTLKAHRDIEGNKTYKLHPLDGEPEIVSADDAHRLCDLGLLDSNKKFPAATFWLTEKGKATIEEISTRTLHARIHTDQ